MANYFHFSPVRLAPGSIIRPGNYGRIIERYSLREANWCLARELIFENIRMQPQFATKPSRLNACFGLPSREDAEKYREANDKNYLQVLHVVEIVEPSAAIHTAGLSFLDDPAHPFVGNMQLAAVNYWKGEPGAEEKGTEVVTTSGWRVLECLE